MRLEPLQKAQEPLLKESFRCSEVVVRDRIELSTFRFSGGRSYRLSYLTWLGTRSDLTWYPCGPDGI
jgi:hypothetical protein